MDALTSLNTAGEPWDPFAGITMVGPISWDRGRYEGIQKLMHDPFRSDGVYSDASCKSKRSAVSKT